MRHRAGGGGWCSSQEMRVTAHPEGDGSNGEFEAGPAPRSEERETEGDDRAFRDRMGARQVPGANPEDIGRLEP
uniref:Uncharacterized protein n=1 Tax=Rangifer tarandus platyrhynchus TaxID=3082113 RepID=A0ACB0DVA1_RANTA|nr:unnamed protein product [Rangifer tarandus platyrhynchus]